MRFHLGEVTGAPWDQGVRWMEGRADPGLEFSQTLKYVSVIRRQICTSLNSLEQGKPPPGERNTNSLFVVLVFLELTRE